MVHRNYHEVEGASPAACAHEVGRLFAPIVQDYISYAREDEDWPAYRQNAQRLLNETARYFPGYVEELGAYAKGARVDLLDLWTMSIEDELDDDGSEKCTTVITNKGRLIGHNEDWDPASSEDICILKKRCGEVTTLELYYYGCPLGGAAISISSRGYVQAINSLDHTDWQIGVPKLVLARRLSEMRSIDAELAGLLSIPRSSGFAHNLIDRHGHVTVVETTATRHSIQHPDLPSVHTNHPLCPGLESLRGEPDGKSTFRRYRSACDLAQPVMDAKQMVRLLADDSRGARASLFNRNTIARAVVDLDKGVASFWLRREAKKGWIDYPINFFCETAEVSA